MPKTIWQKKIAARNAIPVSASEAKHATTAAAHQTTAQANCIFHLRIRLEVALAMPSIAPMIATKMFRLNLPLMARHIRTINMEMPMAIQIELMARPSVVLGWLCFWRDANTPVSELAVTIVTGHG